MQRLRRLSRRRSARHEEGRFLVDGPVLLAEGLAAGVTVEAVYVEESMLADPQVGAARDAGAVVREVASGALGKVLDLRAPQGLVAVVHRSTRTLDDVVDAAARSQRPLVVLVSLQDPGNVGTLVRVAEAAGCAGVVLTTGSVDLHNPKTVRATAGAVFRVAVAEGVGTNQVLERCRSAGLPVWATAGAGGGAVVLEDAPLTGAVALFVGAEAHGLPDEVLASSDGVLTVPMAGAVESLNAAVAGSVVLFEAARQRRVCDPSGRGGTRVRHNGPPAAATGTAPPEHRRPER